MYFMSIIRLLCRKYFDTSITEKDRIKVRKIFQSLNKISILHVLMNGEIYSFSAEENITARKSDR